MGGEGGGGRMVEVQRTLKKALLVKELRPVDVLSRDSEDFATLQLLCP